MNEIEKEIRRIRVSLSRLNTKLEESLHTFIPATRTINSSSPWPDTPSSSGVIATISGTYLYISPEKIQEMQKEIENIRWHLKQLSTLAKDREKTKNI